MISNRRRHQDNLFQGRHGKTSCKYLLFLLPNVHSIQLTTIHFAETIAIKASTVLSLHSVLPIAATRTAHPTYSTIDRNMYPLPSIITLGALCVAAAPTSVDRRESDASLEFYSDSDCLNVVEHPVTSNIPGAYYCFVVTSPANSISVTVAGCSTVTWSGNNCEGSSYSIPDSNCHSLPYGSVSVQC